MTAERVNWDSCDFLIKTHAFIGPIALINVINRGCRANSVGQKAIAQVLDLRDHVLPMVQDGQISQM